MIIIRNSERTALKRCPQRWWWAFQEGLAPKTVDSKLWFGGGIHVALADWYLSGFVRGPEPAKTWLKFVKSEERYIADRGGLFDDVKWVDARDLGVNMLLRYVEEYGHDLSWNVIATEQTFQLRGKTKSGIIFHIAGTFDGVYRDMETGKIMLMEHKSAASIPDTGYLELDLQTDTYFAVAEIVLKAKGIMREDEHLDGIMFNYLKKTMPDNRLQDEHGKYLNKDGSVSKLQPGPAFLRYPAWRSQRQRVKALEDIKSEVELMQMYRSGRLNVTITPTKDCRWDCAFYQMCQLHQSGDDWEEFRDAMFIRQDPYMDHRESLKSAGD